MMVGRRTGLVVVTFLALTFLVSSHAYSMSVYSFGKHESFVRSDFATSYRPGGSVFSPTGDPDEIATYNPPPGGRLNGEIGDLLDAQLWGHSWVDGRVGVCNAFIRYLEYFFRVKR